MSDVFQKALDVEKVPLILGVDERAGYRALPIRNLRVGYEVTFDVFLKVKKKGETIPSFVKACHKGDIFHQDWHDKLTKLNIPNVYVSLQDMDLVMEYINYHLDLLIKDDDKTDLEKGTLVCDAAHLWMLHFYQREEARTGEQINQALKFMDLLFNTVRGDHHTLKCLLEVRRTGSHLFSHCLNVCLIGLAFTAYLGWDQEKVRWFGVGSMLHDVGLMNTPIEILEKRGKLNPEEMNRIKRHPIDGFRMLQNYGYLRWDALQMIVQHHENCDGSGYPDGLVITELNAWSRALRVIDCYEAMTADRSWRQAMEPKQAIWTMRADWEKDKIFDRHYLETLIKFLAGQ